LADALHDLFTNKPIRKFLFRTRWLLALALAIPLAMQMRPEWLPLAIGVAMVGQLIQGWCFASLVKNRELSVRGPYLMTRNPMYLGRYFLILGFVLLLGSWIAVAIYTVLYWPYMLYRVKREEARLKRVFGESFEEYCRQVRRFWPSLRPLTDPRLRFWKNSMFLENNGHWNILLTLLAFGAIWAAQRLM